MGKKDSLFKAIPRKVVHMKKFINKGKKLFFKDIDYSKDISLIMPKFLYKDSLINLSGKLNDSEKLSIISDPVFKALMMNSKKREYMAKFLSCIFKDLTYEETLKNIKFVKNELDKRKVGDKSYRADAVIEIIGNIIDVEMNRSENIERNERYLSRLSESYVSYDGEVGLPLTSVLINLNVYSYTEDSEVMRVYLLKDKEDKLLTSDKQICEIYLLNIIKKYYNKEEMKYIERLLLVGMITEVEIARKIAGDDEIMNNLIDEAILLKSRRGLIKTYEDDLLEKESLIESGKIMGREEGHKNGQAEIIRKMIQKGFSEEDISNTLELDLTYIKGILNTI